MHEFYTVSRKDISALKTLELLPHDPSILLTEVVGLFTQPEAREVVETLYPMGLSGHGRTYLHNRHHFLYDDNKNSYVSYMPMIETTFELVRLWKFPDRPSRFTSMFGSLTITDAEKFKSEYCGGVGDIYKVSTDSFFKADMKLLYTGASFSGNINLATKYWNGESSADPYFEILMNSPVTIISKVL